MVNQLENTPVAKTNDTVHRRGKTIPVAGIQVGSKRLIVEGRFVTVTRVKDEWYDDVGDPEVIIEALKSCAPRPDIFTFWQRLPNVVPIYPYYSEPESLSAITVARL